MRIFVGQVLLLIVALFPLGRALAQTDTPSTHVLLATERPVRIFFPGKVSEILGEHPAIGIRSVEHGTVQLSVLTPEFDSTLITIVLTDGRQFVFDIQYSSDIREAAGVVSSAKNPRRREGTNRSKSRSHNQATAPDSIQ